MGTKLLHSSAYHPQTDGQTEVLNRCLESYLRCFVCDEPKKWSKYLHLAEFWYNTSHHSAIDMTPFKALYGREPPTISHYTQQTSKVATVDDMLQEHQSILATLKETLAKTKQRMADQANKHRTEKEFQVDEMVYLRLRPYRQSSVAHRTYHKLRRRYFGPFKILERIGAVAYRLHLPDGSKIHPVVHVSLLRKCLGEPGQAILPLPDTVLDNIPLFIPEKILDRRVFNNREEVLVKWAHQTEVDASWEPADEIEDTAIDQDLEDKVHLENGGVDTGQPNGAPTNIRPTRLRRLPARYST